MRILVVSDLHYRLPHYDWLLGAAERVDAVALVGDLADVVSPVPHDVQTVVVTKYLGLLAERTRVFAASGNHDLDGPGAHGEQVASWLRRLDRSGLHVDGSSVDIGDTRVTVCPWWDGPTTREEVGRPARRGGGRPARPVGLALPRAAGRHGPVPRRPAYVPGPGPRGLDRRARTRRRPLRPHPPGAVDRERLLARPARRHLGVQRRQGDRAGARSHHPRPGGAARPTGSASTSRGRSTSVEGPGGQWSWSPSGSRAEPVVVGGAWWWTSWSRIWSTIPRCPPASENCCFTSTR